MPAYHVRIALEAHNATSNALIINVLHAEVDTLTSPPNWASVATDVNTWLGTEWHNVLATDDTYDQVVVTDEKYPGSTFGQGVHTVGLIGARSLGDRTLSPAICGVGSWKTAVAKRYARGHSFFPPAYAGSSLTTGGSWNLSGPYWAAMLAFGAKYIAGFTVGSTSYIPEVFSKHLVTLGQTPFSNKITGWSLDGKSHWLRSRNTSP